MMLSIKNSCAHSDIMNTNLLKNTAKCGEVLFSRFHEGIQFDFGGLVMAKPEHISKEIAALAFGRIVFDAFCGIGGCAIAFARSGYDVVACDIRADRIRMAKHNAQIYGLSSRIYFVHSDFRAFWLAQRFDTIFFDPPWGGFKHRRKTQVGFENLDLDIRQELAHALNTASCVIAALPGNFSDDELSAVGPIDRILRFDLYEGAPAPYLTVVRWLPIQREHAKGHRQI